jgi:hypothetical protein
VVDVGNALLRSRRGMDGFGVYGALFLSKRW